MIRAFFIDGPDHGTTRTFESEPPLKWRSTGELAIQSRLTEEDDPIRVSRPTFIYVRTYQTRKGVHIYEYEGIEHG